MYKIVANEFKDCQETLQSKRAVAYLDVLGFKKMIQTKDLSEIDKRYTKLMNEIEDLGEYYKYNTHTNTNENLCKRFIFSDSIMLVANDDSEK